MERDVPVRDKKMKRILAIAIVLILIIGGFSIYVLLPDNNVIATGKIIHDDINGDIIIWTEQTDAGRLLFYRNITKGKTYELAGPIWGQTCDVENNNIVWIETHEDSLSDITHHDIHLYDISSQTDLTIASNITESLWLYTPKISNNIIVWGDEQPRTGYYIDSTFFSYNISQGTTEVILTNITGGHLEEFEGNNMLFLHDMPQNLSVFNIIDSSVFQLTIRSHYHTMSSDYILQEELVSQEDGSINPPYDSYWYLYDLKTHDYELIAGPEQERSQAGIDNDYVVWCGETNEGNRDVYLYNISSKIEINITDNDKPEYNPKISGNNIVFTETVDSPFDKLILYKLA